jgi:hypothetical protein
MRNFPGNEKISTRQWKSEYPKSLSPWFVTQYNARGLDILIHGSHPIVMDLKGFQMVLLEGLIPLFDGHARSSVQ